MEVQVFMGNAGDGKMNKPQEIQDQLAEKAASKQAKGRRYGYA